MMELNNMNIIVLDLETLYSADDCRYCGTPLKHVDESHCPNSPTTGHAPIGWTNRPALGLSIGCYWDYADQRMHWFDVPTLEATMRLFVKQQPLLVSYNGCVFDFVVMRGLLRREAEALSLHGGTEDLARADALVQLCDAFKVLCATSYDLLAKLRAVSGRGGKDTSTLDAVSWATLGRGKTGTGAEAPRLWAAGQYAAVLNYCAWDVDLTKALFERVCSGQPLRRGDGVEVLLPLPALEVAP